jgi:hypothetical protein
MARESDGHAFIIRAATGERRRSASRGAMGATSSTTAQPAHIGAFPQGIFCGGQGVVRSVVRSVVRGVLRRSEAIGVPRRRGSPNNAIETLCFLILACCHV